MSLTRTTTANTSDTSNTTTGRRRRLATSLSDPLSFLSTSAPIFAMMGAFLGVYIIIVIFQKNIDNCCLSCPRIKFYAEEIC